MKKHIVLLSLWLVTSLAMQVSAQLINMNPDPNGEPWWAGGLPEITPEIQAELDAIPMLTLSTKSLSTPLPSVVDNSQKIWFRPIFSQNGGSCGQASGIGYLFTYEVNRVRNLPANEEWQIDNQYPTHFTWNYLNEGLNEGSWYYHGWDIINTSGIPTVEEYGGLWKPISVADGRRTIWETGYDKYNSFLDNRVIVEYYSINVSTPEGLEELKHWINDHGVGDYTGGLANFACRMPHPINGYGILPQESDEPGKKIILQFSNNPTSHAMTIVGYNDNVKFDFNGDGQFTNPEGNMEEWEIGALKVANSWGDGYQDSGFVYMPYRLLAPGPGSILTKNVHVLRVKEEYSPKVTIKAKISHPSRNKIDIRAGIAEDASYNTPTITQTFAAYNLKKGGDLPMQGNNDEPIEIVLDVSDLLIGFIPAKRFFLEIVEDSDATYNGEILEFSIVHHNTPNGIPIETNYTEQDLPVDIASNSTTTLGIDYNYPDVCPPETITLSGYIHLRSPITIPTGVTLNIAERSIIHFEDEGKLTVGSGAVLNIAQRCTIKFEDEGKLIVESGAALNIDQRSTIHFEDDGKLILQSYAYLNIAGLVEFTKQPNCLPHVEFYNDFVVNSSFSSEVDFIIHDEAQLTIESGYTLTMKENAGIQVKQGGTLAIEECARYKHSSSGIIEVKSNAILQINQYAILDVSGHSAFDISAGVIIPSQSVHPLDVVPPSYIVTDVGQVWSDANYHMVRDLVIQPESGLTLQDPNLKFFGGRKIEIYPNGIINIDGGLLTHSESVCNPRINWSGIIVRGNPVLPQTNQNQGVLMLNNGATVKNAVIAVQLGTKNPFSNPVYQNQGGIVQANNAQFLNNQSDVEFFDFQNTDSQGQPIDNISSFHYCNFTTNDNTLFSTHHENVKLSGVHGIVFNHAQFADNRSNLDYASVVTARKGIQGLGSTFMVYNSLFDKLYYGIYATSTNPNHYFKVYNSDFTSYRGIYFNMMDNVTIKNNDFYIAPGYDYHGVRCSDTYGIYINESANFAIENNIFESSSDGSVHCGILGIVANNTGDLVNEIYRNNFTGFSVGIEAMGQNKGVNYHEGLQLKCNIFEENSFDIFVTPGINPPIPAGIRELQGYGSNPDTSTPAGNLFGNDSRILISNFINDGDFISYYHHDLSESRVKPLIFSGSLYFHEMIFEYDYNLSCLENQDPTPYTVLLARMQDAQAQYEETSLFLQSHMDDGNTDLMTQQVEMAGDGDAYTTYQYLMQTSPFLSEEVLTALGAKEDGFNKAMIRDVLVENPQSAKSEDVSLALDNRQDLLPAYMRWQINNGLYNFSEMEVMRHFMAYQKTRHDRALNRILGGIIRNEEGFENAPPVEEILAGVDDIRYQYMLAEWHFGKGDFSQGMQLLGQIGQDYDLSEDALWNAHEDKLGFYNWLSQWDQEEHPGYTQLPTDALQELHNYLDATPRIAGKALSLLVLNEAIEYEEPILYPDVVLKSEPAHQQTMPLIPEMDEEFTFRLYPNPSREYITLDWCFDSPQMKGVIEIRNASGVLLDAIQVRNQCDQQIYPLTQLRSGNYTATLVSGNHIRKSLSFVVIK